MVALNRGTRSVGWVGHAVIESSRVNTLSGSSSSFLVLTLHTVINFLPQVRDEIDIKKRNTLSLKIQNLIEHSQNFHFTVLLFKIA